MPSNRVRRYLHKLWVLDHIKYAKQYNGLNSINVLCFQRISKKNNKNEKPRKSVRPRLLPNWLNLNIFIHILNSYGKQTQVASFAHRRQGWRG